MGSCPLLEQSATVCTEFWCEKFGETKINFGELWTLDKSSYRDAPTLNWRSTETFGGTPCRYKEVKKNH